MHNAKYEPAGLRAITRVVLPGIAVVCRRFDNEDGQVGTGHVLLADPGSHGHDHGAQMICAGLGAFANSWLLGALRRIQIRLETRDANAGSIGLTGAWARA